MTMSEFSIPSMREIERSEWNGLNVVSTFAGGGGSSTGYRMAGFRVLYCNEFVPAARETYSANMAPHTIVNGDDVRGLSGESILSAIDLDVGELDVLDGSPPCASFSTAGALSRNWGKVNKYSDTAQRTDDLFPEFARLLREMRPKSFIAENVSGLVRGVSKGYFKLIFRELQECGYNVKSALVDSAFLGVPQFRKRIIFMGVRDDLRIEPSFPTPMQRMYSVDDALAYVSRVHPLAQRDDAPSNHRYSRVIEDAPDYWEHTARWIDGEPYDDETGAFIGLAGTAMGKDIRRNRVGERSTKFVQRKRSAPEVPVSTITASGGNRGTAGPAHPSSLRQFTLAEVRALCGFPHDFVLTGEFAQRWERMGRSVPPVMMSHIAAHLRDRLTT